MKLILSTCTPLTFKTKNLSFYTLALVIIPTSNNSQINVRNGMKICFLVTGEVNFTILLKNLGVYTEKIKVR